MDKMEEYAWQQLRDYKYRGIAMALVLLAALAFATCTVMLAR